MADTPVEVDINTDNLDEFEALFSGKATAKTVEQETPTEEEVTPVEDTDETEQTETEAETEVEGDETPDGEDEAETEDEEEIVLKPKKKSAKDRIDELTAEKYAERRLREETERRLADLERQLRESNTKEPRQEPIPPRADNRGPHPDDVDANGQALYPLGEFDRNYVAAVSRFESEQNVAALREELRIEAEQARQAAEDRVRFESWNAKLDKTSEDLPDLRESIAGLEKNFLNLDPNYGTYLAQTIMSLDAGPQVLYYLANHPDEADRIVASGPTGATLALGRLEARIQSALTKKATATPRVTTAQKPPMITRGTGSKTAIRADTENLDDFEKLFYNKK